MKKNALVLFTILLTVHLSSIRAQIQTGVFRTPAGNTDYHHFTGNNAAERNR